MQNIIENITNSFSSNAITTSVIVAVLIMTVVLSVYEFIVYRFISHIVFCDALYINYKLSIPEKSEKSVTKSQK